MVGVLWELWTGILSGPSLEFCYNLQQYTLEEQTEYLFETIGNDNYKHPEWATFSVSTVGHFQYLLMNSLGIETMISNRDFGQLQD